MCLIAFSYKQHPQYDLVFIANRDEFYERPTRKARFWDEEPDILAGKDLKAGGTWMGITRDGRLSALTNYRDMANRKENAPSRGHLVRNFLAGDIAPESYLQQLHSKAEQYNGFNLLVGSIHNLMYYSNKTGQPVSLDAGLYGLSNHLLDTPWPKTERSKKQLSEVIRQDTIDESSLFEILKNDQAAPDSRLPDTGLSRDLERAVSPIFIATEEYGTRCSTILLVGSNGQVTFEERRYKKGSATVKDNSRFEFELEGR
ncbi:NRDE family protein [Halalkalibaculum sp. DA3122]|uniref:NRDE family protein n=1 Tax=unclassified Halalkalibaculum TaxID=2964617 RepID=UPI0037546531